MKTKKAQSEIITTVLIILLVLAAIVIVWQVVQGTIKTGGEAITTQSSCIGVAMEVNRVGTTGNVFSIARKGGGTLIGTITVKTIIDGNSATVCTWAPSSSAWATDLTSATCTLAALPTTSVEAGLILADGTACPVTGKWTP